MERPSIGTIGVILVVLAASGGFFFGMFGGEAFAASCGSKLNQVDYSARFTLSGSARLPKQAGRLRVGMASEGGHLVWIARIDLNQQCQAVCEVQRLEVEKFGGSAPVSLDLKCHSSGFVPLETKATVFFASETQAKPVLRFGTWLEGYQDLNLAVDRDRFTSVKKTAIASRN